MPQSRSGALASAGRFAVTANPLNASSSAWRRASGAASPPAGIRGSDIGVILGGGGSPRIKLQRRAAVNRSVWPLEPS